MSRMIYIKTRVNQVYYEWCECNTVEHPCLEITVITSNAASAKLCEKCDERVACLVSLNPCYNKVVWHVCNGSRQGVYFIKKIPAAGGKEVHIQDSPGADEEVFKRLTGLTFEDVVAKLYRR